MKLNGTSERGTWVWLRPNLCLRALVWKGGMRRVFFSASEWPGGAGQGR